MLQHVPYSVGIAMYIHIHTRTYTYTCVQKPTAHLHVNDAHVHPTLSQNFVQSAVFSIYQEVVTKCPQLMLECCEHADIYYRQARRGALLLAYILVHVCEYMCTYVCVLVFSFVCEHMHAGCLFLCKTR
jgi:hypothetical protein